MKAMVVPEGNAVMGPPAVEPRTVPPACSCLIKESSSAYKSYVRSAQCAMDEAGLKIEGYQSNRRRIVNKFIGLLARTKSTQQHGLSTILCKSG